MAAEQIMCTAVNNFERIPSPFYSIYHTRNFLIFLKPLQV